MLCDLLWACLAGQSSWPRSDGTLASTVWHDVTALTADADCQSGLSTAWSGPHSPMWQRGPHLARLEVNAVGPARRSAHAARRVARVEERISETSSPISLCLLATIQISYSGPTLQVGRPA